MSSEIIIWLLIIMSPDILRAMWEMYETYQDNKAQKRRASKAYLVSMLKKLLFKTTN